MASSKINRICVSRMDSDQVRLQSARMKEREWTGRQGQGGGQLNASSFTHAGSNTQNFLVVWMAPARDFAVLVMTNQAGGSTPKACDEAATALIVRFNRKA
jgi:hypothetical protein